MTAKHAWDVGAGPWAVAEEHNGRTFYLCRVGEWQSWDGDPRMALRFDTPSEAIRAAAGRSTAKVVKL